MLRSVRAAGIDSAEHLLLQRQLRWLAHVIRMPSNRLPRRILYGELVNGQRLPGGPIISCGTWTKSVVSWTSAIYLLPNWSSFQLTETHGKVPVPAAWQHTICLQIKQIDVPAGTIQPTHQLLVRNAHSAAESVLPSSACAAIYGVMSHVHISNTPSTNVIVELDGLLQPSIYINSSVETFCVLAVTTHNFVRIPQWNITEMKFTYRVWPKLYLWSRLYRCRDICPKQLQQI